MLRFRLAPDNLTVNFMRLRRISYPFSAVMSILSVAMFLFVGLNFGIDFEGGVSWEVKAPGVSDETIWANGGVGRVSRPSGQ